MTMATGKFHYAGRTAEEVTRRAKQSSGDWDSPVKDGFTMFRHKEGENIIRILPPGWLNYDEKGRLIRDAICERWGTGWEIQVWAHRYLGSDGKSTFLCLEKEKNDPCPACEARRQCEDADERKALAPTLVPLVWIIDRKDEKAGPQWWIMPFQKVFQEICRRSTDKKTGAVLLIDDPEEGYDVEFERTGSGKTGTNYTGIDVYRDPSPLHENEKIKEKWKKYIRENSLPEILHYEDPDYMEKVLMGKISKKQDENEEDETPTRKDDRTREVTRVGRKVDDEEETEEEGVASSMRSKRSDDEEDAPRPRSKAQLAPAPEDDEEAPFDDEDDKPKPKHSMKRAAENGEDDDAPRSRKRAAAVEEEGEDEELPESKSAKKGLERLKPRAGKRPREEELEADE